MSAPFKGLFVRKVLNIGRNANVGGTPHFVVEFRGPDGLRYVATYFGPGACAVICLPAPMRGMMPGAASESGFEAEIRFVLALAQHQESETTAQPQAPSGDEDDSLVEEIEDDGEP